MFVFWKIWRALLPCYLRLRIRPFVSLSANLKRTLENVILLLVGKKRLQ